MWLFHGQTDWSNIGNFHSCQKRLVTFPPQPSLVEFPLEGWSHALFFLHRSCTICFAGNVTAVITCRAKLLSADWLRQRAFFLNQEGTFGNQKGMITWCWLAEHACIKLVSRFKRSLKRNFRDASLLSLILTRSFHLNVKENQHATKRSHSVEKQKDFSDQKCVDSQRENSLSGDGWCRTKH